MDLNYDLMVDEAFAWVAKRATLVPCVSASSPSDKYIVRSAFQKAVRRGLSETAVRLLLRLHRLDAAYVRRALLTVALEDVGFGSPDAILWATAARSSYFRMMVGEIPLLLAITVELCRACKTRSACELAFITDTKRKAMFSAFSRWPSHDLADAVAGDDPAVSYAALSVLRGVVPRGLPKCQPDTHALEAVAEIMRGQLPPPLARAAVATLWSPLDEMSLAAFPSFRLGLEGEDREVNFTPFVELGDIGGYASEAYDQHERRGRAAIGRLTERLSERLPWLLKLKPGSRSRAVGDAVFVVEGSCLDRWAGSAALHRLRAKADEVSLTRHGLSTDEAEALTSTVLHALPELHNLRHEVAEGR